MFPLLFDFLALDPEVNSARLFAGPGSAPMKATAASYGAVADGLHTAAAGSDGSMGQMDIVWRGPAADKAQRAFRNHANWLRTQGDAASTTSAIAAAIGQANDAARATMPSLAEILWVKAAIAAASTTAPGNMGLTTATVAVLEGVRMAQRFRAAVVMSTYAAVTLDLVALLPPPAEAPPIVTGPPGLAPPEAPPVVPVGGGPAGRSGGGSGNGSGPGGSNQVGPGGQPGGGPGQPGSGGGGEPGNPGQSGGNPGQPGGGEGTPSGQTPPPQVQQPASEFPTLPGDSASGLDGGGAVDPAESALPGTSADSSTLAGLNGGLGSMVALGMIPGGFGAMPGSATGFRMPTNWSTMPTRAFGMGTGNPAAQPVPQRTAPRGVTAPRARRRREQDDRKPAKAFAPGESQDVPILEEPPAIGVIEYLDGDGQQESASEQILALGEFPYDTDSDPILESAAPIRPR